jgi:hypothetical protein
MEETLGFEDIAEHIEPWSPSEEFLRDFQAYMEESVRQSRLNEANAWLSARDIIINI